ncbi:tyrosine-protein phosphatase [Enterocloster asparagiformis]|uniref:Tyrosine-protein phosphatase family protein n=2 Tax=Enterocloster asparagiformis TaxID=333367 RepID=C0D882_9FIRM|nr:tyrosine-protein phosphatase [Enterocloster asparagiformis]EEG52469.1 Tyrosine-protein phosphatase family protein [[Clostridium] asparagiforme DSM 15981]RGX30335.1 protein-tyrosine-phosphatase [Enterocloster asparagiformis]UWO77569.1 tyrosine-protein phosphatase [[Clostridium] asparagiforme DSM 15981]
MEQHIRRLRLSHVANVRDLGGYEADGGVIRWNRLYRAGDLSGADAGDWERLKAAGVRTILDLRSASELRAKPDRPPQGISWYHLPLQTEEIDLEHPADLAGLAFLKSLRESYVIMAGENTGLLAAALARLTASLDDGAVLFHCTAGKDRTGVLAAAVLWLCGAAREDIVADYEVSRTYNQDGLGALADKMPDCDQLLPLLRSEPENMERLLDFFRESGLDGRLAESGFSAEEQRRLRERMIQKG